MKEGPDDLVFGAFTSDPPWLVSPDEMTWRVGLDALRERTRARVPQLVARPKIPPVRTVVVAAHLAWAIVPWAIRERTDRSDPAAIARLAPALRAAFERLGTTFLKLGQILASADGMLPAPLVDEFKSCRDQVPPESFRHVRAVIEADLGRPLEAVFATFDPQPMAAASIAQVHTATLPDGTDVVVKVQRPGIDRTVGDDLAAMAWVAPLIEKRSPELALINIPAYIELFAETILEELDFRLEAQNMLDIAGVLAATGQRTVVVPRPHPTLVTRRVLVMERLRGFKIDDDAEMVSAGVDPSPVFTALMVAFFEGALIHGVFHGDLHGGNMIVTPDGRPGLFDFGITGRLAPKARQAMLTLLASGSSGDTRTQLEAFRDLGGFPLDADLDRIEAMRLDERTTAPKAEMTPEELAAETRDLVTDLVSHGARLPKDLFHFIKGMVYLNGAIATLAADVDLFGEMEAVSRHFIDAHGEQLVEELGVDLSSLEFDVDAMRDQLRQQTGTDVDTITYREMQTLQAEERARARKR